MVAAAVIIHLVTDGTWLEMDLDQKQESIFVQLVDTKNQSHDLGENASSVITQHDIKLFFFFTSPWDRPGNRKIKKKN